MSWNSGPCFDDITAESRAAGAEAFHEWLDTLPVVEPPGPVDPQASA
jgi:hypothetical protein